MKKQITGSLALAVGLSLLSAGCSGAAHDDRSTPKAKPSPTGVQEVTYDECVDGRATVLASDASRNGRIAIGDCNEVSVVGAASPGSTIELGRVELLVVEGDGATIHLDRVDRIVVPGNHNTVTHVGESEVDDQGTGNTITAS